MKTTHFDAVCGGRSCCHRFRAHAVVLDLSTMTYKQFVEGG